MLYTYERMIDIGNIKTVFIVGIKESKITRIAEKFAYILEWFSVGALFYLNSIFIHSRLFSLFLFILGICLLFTLKVEKKLSTKEEFLNKVNAMFDEVNQCENQ